MSDVNVFHIPSGCKTAEEFSNYVHSKIMECLKDYKSKEATLKHLLDGYQIKHDQTNTFTEMMKHSLSTLKSINSTSEEMLKLISDRIAQAKSLKRQREEQEQVRGQNEQSENLQDQNQPLPQVTQRLDQPGKSNQRRRHTK